MLRRVALTLHGVPFVVQHAVQTEPECVSISTHIVRVVAAKMLMAFELFKGAGGRSVRPCRKQFIY